MKSFTNNSNDKQTKMNLAFEQGNAEFIGELLAKGEFHTNYSMDGKMTLLQTAALRNDVAIVRLLLTRNADPNLKISRDTLSPLWLAVLHRFHQVEELLIRAGANVNELLGDSAHQYAPNYDSLTTMLHIVASNSDDERVCLLVAYGADVTACNSRSESVLHFAVSAECQPSTVALLLDRGANLEAATAMSRTPLHSAIAVGNVSLVQLLLDRGADLRARHRSGKNALHFAAEAYKENPEVAEILIKKGIPVNETDRIYSHSPLHLAIRTDKRRMMECLMDNGADISAVTASGEFPLYLAVQFGSARIMKILFNKGVDVNQQIQSFLLSGQTALHCACSNESAEKIRMLLEHGADINIKNRSNKTPFELLKNKYTPAAHEMVKYFVIMTTMRNAAVNKKDLQAIEDDRILRQVYIECLQEIEEMKRIEIYNSITCFMLFNMSENKLATLLRNTDFLKAYENMNNLDMISWFHRDLEDIIEKAKKVRNIQYAMENYLNYSFCSKLPNIIISKLISFLRPGDLPL